MSRPSSVPGIAALCALVLTASSCASAIRRVQAEGSSVPLSQLWREPTNLASRDLYHGVGGQALRPSEGPYELLEEDTTGASPGYDVRDARGRTWSVKLGIEAQPEVVMSRILWAIGFHQDPMHYLTDWRFDTRASAPTPPARFRLERETRDVVGEWSWRENPFVGTRPYMGLLVANLLFNNWDWKTNNNKIYAVRDGERTVREYVVRDLGAALGGTDTYPVWLQWSRMRGILQGTKNNLEDFEQQGFIRKVDGDRVSFHYQGIHGDLLDTITVADVIWTCEWLSRLSDRQWDDAFRAGGYPRDVRTRYIAHINRKIAEGLALRRSTSQAASAIVKR
jgi:hypothetical protein